MDVKNIVERLGADEAVRKMAVFQLQKTILVSSTHPLTRAHCAPELPAPRTLTDFARGIGPDVCA
jgi:hypothetical protein